jgi:drug/metabolite transporter (DMT)-like permease
MSTGTASATAAPAGGFAAAVGPRLSAAPHPAAASTLSGWAWGAIAALVWGGYMASARAGTLGGLTPPDFALLRYGTAGLILLPVLARGGLGTLGGVGWPRGLVLAALAGPAFILFGTLGFRWAPLAHGAVVQPATVTLGAMALAMLLLGERVAPRRWAGAAVVLAGLLMVSGDGGFGGGEAWRGDLCFAAAGLLWAAFTVLGRRWGVAPMAATAVVSVVGGAIAVLVFLAFGDAGALLAQGPRVILTQAVVQGPLSGILAVYAFARAVAALGAARAALFTALVPGVAVLLGVPAAGEWPTPQ